MKAIIAAALLGAILLGGCEPGEDKIRECVASTEPTILLRQLALPAKGKEAYEWCLKEMNIGGVRYCRWLYLNAEDPMRDCMLGKGFSHKQTVYGMEGLNIEVPGCKAYWEYDNAACYGRTWYVELVAGYRKALAERNSTRR